MCHQAIRPTLPGQDQASGGAPSADSDPPAQEEFQNQDSEAAQETQSTPAVPDPAELQEETETCCGTHHQPVEGQGEDQNNLNPGGDCVCSCTSGAPLSSRVHKEDEEIVGDSSLPPPPDEPDQNFQGEITEQDFKLNSVPQSDRGETESCVEAPESHHGSKSHDSSNTSLLNSQVDDESVKENLEYSDVTQSYSDWLRPGWAQTGPQQSSEDSLPCISALKEL